MSYFLVTAILSFTCLSHVVVHYGCVSGLAWRENLLGVACQVRCRALPPQVKRLKQNGRATPTVSAGIPQRAWKRLLPPLLPSFFLSFLPSKAPNIN